MCRSFPIFLLIALSASAHVVPVSAEVEFTANTYTSVAGDLDT